MSDLNNGLTASIEFELGGVENINKAVEQIGRVQQALLDTTGVANETMRAIGDLNELKLPDISLKDVGDGAEQSVSALVAELNKAVAEAEQMDQKLGRTTDEAKATERAVTDMAAEINIAVARSEKLARQAQRLQTNFNKAAEEAKRLSEMVGLTPDKPTGDTDVVFDVEGFTEARQDVLDLQSAINGLKGETFIIPGFDRLQAEAMQARNAVSSLGIEIRQIGNAWPAGNRELVPYHGEMAVASRDAQMFASAIYEVVAAMIAMQRAYKDTQNVLSGGLAAPTAAIGPGSSEPINLVGPGFSHQMKQIEGAIPIVTDAGLSISSMAHQSKNFIQVSKGMEGPYTDLRNGMEGLTWTAHEGVTAAQQFAATQGGVAENTGKAGNSLSNQRYALYDVADAYRTVSYAATAWIAATAGTAILFEKEFAEVIRTVELTGDNIDDIRDKLIDLSTELPIAFSDLTSIAGLGGQLGIEADGIEQFTEVVAKLSATTDLTTEAASFMIGRFQAILGTAPDDFERLASAVLAVGVSSNATEQEIAKTSTEIAALSQQAGLTEQQIIALSATFASGGIPAERARSTVLETFSKMDRAIRDNGEELRRWSQLSGVSMEEFAASWGTDEFFHVFSRSMEGLQAAGEKGSAVLEDLGITSRLAVPSLLTLSTMTDGLANSLGLAEGHWDSTAALTEHYDIVAQTAAAQMVKLKNELQALFNVVGSAVLGSGWFTDILQIAQDATWAFRNLIDSIPGGDTLMGLATGIIAVAGVLAGFRATQALVTAASYAMASAKDALGQSAAQTAGALRGLLSAVFGVKSAVDQDTASTVANTTATQANAVAKGVATTANQAETGSLTALVMTRKQAAIAAVTGNALDTKVRAGQALRIQLIRAQTAWTTKMTAAQVADTVATRASTAATTAWNAAKSAGIGISTAFGTAILGAGTAVKALIRSLLPLAGIMAGLELLSWGLGKLRDGAKETKEVWTELSEAIDQDTRKYEETGEAIAVMAIAVDEAGNVHRSDVTEMTKSLDTTELLAKTKEELADKANTVTGSVLDAVEAQGLFGDEVESTTAKIHGQIVAIDEATIKAYADKLREAPDGMSQEMWDRTLTSYQDLAKAGAEGSISLDRVTAAAMGNADALNEVQGNYNTYNQKLGEANERMRVLRATGQDRGPGGFFTKEYQDLADEVDRYTTAVERAQVAVTLLEKLDPDFEGFAMDQEAERLATNLVRVGMGLEALDWDLDNTKDSVDDLKDSFHDVMATQMGFAASLYDLGASLFENGVNFDIFSESGRANMSALDSAFEAAVKNAAGDGQVLVQNMAVLGQALVNNGMDAVRVMELLTKKYAAIQQGGIGGAIAAPMVISAALNQTVPAINGFRRSLDEGYTDAMNRAREASKKGAKGMDGVGDSAKDAAKEVRTLADYVSDLSKVFDRSFDFRWGVQQSLDDVADAWQGVHDWAKEAAERIEDAKDEIQDAKDAIRDAKNELKSLSAEMSTLQADEGILEYHLRVAIDYGDTLRADQIRAELEENRAKQAEVKAKQDDAGRDVDTSHQDLAKATQELADANRDAQKDLSGTTASAREQRDMVWDLLSSYQDQIQAYADTGASAQELEAYTRRLKGEFEEQLRQLGYNQTEVRKYSATFDDLIAVIKNVPRNVTVAVDANPALRALEEFRAGLSKTNTSIDNTKSKARDLNSALGGVNGIKTDKTREEFRKLTAQFRPLIDRVKEFYDNLFKKAPADRGGGSVGMFLTGQRTTGGRTLLEALGFAKGGLVPDVSGTFGFKPQGTDTVPAMLTPGEYVIPRETVQSLGVPFLEALRKGQGGTPMTGSTYIHNSAPQVQVVELMPHQFNAMVTAVSSNVGRAMVNGADLSVASARSNQRAVRAGAN